MAEQEEGKRLYDRTREELDKRQIINSQIYDTSILAFSMGTLAVLANLLQGLHLDCCSFIIMSFATICFFLAVSSTLVSFMISNKALKKQLEKAERYYLRGDEKALKETDLYHFWLIGLNYFSGVMFILGLLSTLIGISRIVCKNL